jgi:hypothetical protein
MEEYGEEYVAVVRSGGNHLKLTSKCLQASAWAVVYDMKVQTNIIDEAACDLQDGKNICEECAKGVLGKALQIKWVHKLPASYPKA